MPNNRQWAFIIWMGILTVYLLSKQEWRSKLGGMAAIIFRSKVGVLLGLMAIYVVGLLTIGNRLGVWVADLSTDTSFWYLGSGSVLFFKLNEATKPKFFRSAFLSALEITLIVEFLMNVLVFGLAVELVLQPLLILIFGVSAFAATKREFAAAKRIVDGLLASIGFVFALVVAVRLVREWTTLNLTLEVLRLLLPIWLTLGLVPFLAGASVWLSYDQIYVHIRAEAENRKSALLGMLAIVVSLGLRRREVLDFVGLWPRQLAKAKSFSERQEVIRSYVERRTAARLAEREFEDRQMRYQGSTEVDKQGRRFDRRGFDEAKGSLMTLGAFQTDYYRRTGRYARELAEIIPATMSRLIEVEADRLRLWTNGPRTEYWIHTRTPSNFVFGVAGRNGEPGVWLYAGESEPAGGIDDDDWRNALGGLPHVEW